MLSDSRIVVICLFVCIQQLTVATSYYCYGLPDNQQWLCTKVEGGLPLDWFTGGEG